MILACWVERQEQLDYRSCFAPFWETRAIWKSVLSPSLILERAVTQSHSTAVSEAGVCQIHLNVMSVVFLKPNTLVNAMRRCEHLSFAYGVRLNDLGIFSSSALC